MAAGIASVTSGEKDAPAGGFERKPVLYAAAALFAGPSCGSEEIGHSSQAGRQRFKAVFKKSRFYPSPYPMVKMVSFG